MRRVCTAVSLGVALHAGPARAQDDPEQRLTGGSSRAWTLQSFAQPVDPAGACSSGEIYTFAVTHQLTITRCRDGRAVQSQHAWSISGADRDNPTLTIAGIGTFALRFHRSGAGGHRMRLGIGEELTLDED